MKGSSRTNLLYMSAFAEAYPDEQIVQQLAGQIPWFHNCILLDKVKAPAERLWYVLQTIQYGLGVGFAFMGNQHYLLIS